MNEKLLQVMSTPMTNQHEPGTEAASAKGEYAGTDSGLEADGGISMADNKRGRASLSFLGPFDHVDCGASVPYIPRAGGGRWHRSDRRGGRELWAGSLD